MVSASQRLRGRSSLGQLPSSNIFLNRFHQNSVKLELALTFTQLPKNQEKGLDCQTAMCEMFLEINTLARMMGPVSVSQGTPMAFGLWANAAVTLLAAAG